MKLDKFNLLKKKYEESAFEHNFFTLDKILYWFSFLGNIFSIIFSYFFIKTVTDTIPEFFSGQDFVFSVFIVIFMTGYEFLKRFTFEQVVVYIFKLKKATTPLILGSVFALLLIVGSFYMSLNGSHRIIDQTESVNSQVENTIQSRVDSISSIYQNRITNYQSLIDQINQNAVNGRLRNKDKTDIKNYESKISELQSELDSKVTEIESKQQSKADKKISSAKSNTLAMVMMTLFMELIILLGVGFNGFYNIASFTDMKHLLNTPKYKSLNVSLSLLHLYYQKGNKKEGDEALSMTKLKALTSNQKLNVRNKEVDEFVALCSELGIVSVGNNRKKYYVVSYEKAKELLTNNI